MSARARTAERITSEVDPDLAEVKRFILERIAQGAFAVLIASILALLVSMRDLNTELHRRLEASRRKRPPSETLRRLQMELPLLQRRKSPRSVVPRLSIRTDVRSCQRI